MEEEEASQLLVPNRCFHHTRVGSLHILSVVRNLTPVPMLLPIFCWALLGDLSSRERKTETRSSWLSCALRDGGRTKCQPDKMPTGQNANLGWHFVRDFFSMVGILSGPTFWLAFCPDHLKMSWHPLPPPPPNVREWGGPVTSFCLLLTVVGEK